jgi:DNA-binding NarL/FixJ family response regulator
MTGPALASIHLTAVDQPPSTTRVVIADGERLVRAGVRALLEEETGIAVVGEAATGDDAVALARRLQPDVVLIDVQLPGLDCVAATRQMLAAHGVAVMLLTSNGADDRILAALRAGASGLLLKDTEPAQLVRAVRILASGAAVLSLLPDRSTR